ncbi:FliI/YscN family ATPase [Parendozoicomonas haliclonae]|uniref:protein-secreting ATPase n=1 Tax=Parendozoicomonas haliclonae TaxID=1960125 RepID=A0A1X7ANP6_9GAMM|nr:FliI/YscN family ATPase [Parendozoicomonas haliclonae]SMA49885.1 putative ATP synthase YscN [Parendozoicomonas haliclonae]
MGDIQACLSSLETAPLIKRAGRITDYHGLVLESLGPDAVLGELCELVSSDGQSLSRAEVVGFHNGKLQLVPFSGIEGIRPGDQIFATGHAPDVICSRELLGRIVNAHGEPIDGSPLSPRESERRPLKRQSPGPLSRKPISGRMDTGVVAIDSFLAMGYGQRVGVFAGSGVGKSTLLGQIARTAKADVHIIAMIGERGREVVEFIEDILGPEGMKSAVVVVATADEPALMRVHAAYAATTLAEYFCDQGLSVTLTMDSVTRFAMALREIGLAAGEPPTARGYTPSCFSEIPKLIERAGNFQGKGSISAFYTVLVEGDDLNEPISDTLRAILDGHILLTRERANLGLYPAIDLLQSVSRLSTKLTTDEEQETLRESRRLLALYQENRELIQIGAYQKGVDRELDRAIVFQNTINQLLFSNQAALSHQQLLEKLQSALQKPPVSGEHDGE